MVHTPRFFYKGRSGRNIFSRLVNNWILNQVQDDDDIREGPMTTVQERDQLLQTRH